MNRDSDTINEAIAKASADGQREQSCVLNGPGHHACDHGISFDEAKYKSFCVQHNRGDEQVAFIRKNWPRLDGQCPKGCGYVGIYYASFLHYVAGDW